MILDVTVGLRQNTQTRMASDESNNDEKQLMMVMM
jgi:hypothetical protein